MANNRGIALILVILIISIIIAVTLQLNVASRSEIYEAANTRDGIKTQYIAKSGISIGRSILKGDKTASDSVHDDWANVEKVLAEWEPHFEEGFFELKIFDESGKIPINSLVDGNEFNGPLRELVIRFLTLPEIGLEERDANDIVDAIKDWLDKDDEITEFGAENNYYKGLDRPYPCKNGPLESIAELLMIRGITRELYYGTDEREGIAPYLTIVGRGTININTAPTLVLRTLSGEITTEMAADMDAYRLDEDNELSTTSWYQNVPGMAGTNIDEGMITIKSNIFKLVSVGHLGNMSQRITAVVDRSGASKNPNILSWDVD